MTSSNGKAARVAGEAPGPRAGRPYRGPVVVLSMTEAARVRACLTGSTDEQDRAILAKCTAALGADPSWREPLK
jgi:hypothetical protein